MTPDPSDLDVVAGELFKMMTGTDMLLVSYRGVAPAATDLLGGQVQVMFNSLPPARLPARQKKPRHPRKALRLSSAPVPLPLGPRTYAAHARHQALCGGVGQRLRFRGDDKRTGPA
jgi:Tripartite tricarboxylate transporter family receptor